MTVMIRKVKEEDLAAVIKLFAVGQNDALSIKHVNEVLAQMSAHPNYTLFVALKDSQIVAAFSLLIMDNLAHEGAPGGVMDELVINPASDTLAIATKIMDFLLALCDERQCYKLCVPNHHSLVQDLLGERSYFAQHGRCFVMDIAKRNTVKKPFSLLNKGLALLEAECADLFDILNLYKQPGMDDKVLSADGAAQIYNKIKDYPDYKIYVIRAEKTIIGTFALLVAPSLTLQNKSLAVVEDVMVSPRAQGMGVGKFMMECALQLAEKKGCYKLALSSNLKREAAHGFYLSLGFEEQGGSFLMTPKLEACSVLKASF
jgi:GNAT superfamily N-acetyltransferase